MYVLRVGVGGGCGEWGGGICDITNSIISDECNFTLLITDKSIIWTSVGTRRMKLYACAISIIIEKAPCMVAWYIQRLILELDSKIYVIPNYTRVCNYESHTFTANKLLDMHRKNCDFNICYDHAYLKSMSYINLDWLDYVVFCLAIWPYNVKIAPKKILKI